MRQLRIVFNIPPLQSAHENSFRQDANGVVPNFRYNVNPKARVSTFESKAVPAGTDWLNMRSTWFGAAARGHYTSLPKSHMGAILWEVFRT